MKLQRRHIQAGDATLELSIGGPADRPTLLFVHGYPDSHHVWLPLMAGLASDFQVVSFDLRGVGGSVPSAPDYRLTTMVDDVEAVIDAVVGPAGQVHLVGHDWGSVIGWACVDSRLGPRLASYTSMSGPHLGLYLRYLRTGFRSANPGRWAGPLRQLLASFYIGLFAVPGLAERIWRLVGPAGYRAVLRLGGVPAGDSMLEANRAEMLDRTQPTLQLYRQNLRQPSPAPKPGSLTTPTLLIVATRDAFITPGLFHDLRTFAPNLTVASMPAGHWVQRSHTEQVLLAVKKHVSASIVAPRKLITAPEEQAHERDQRLQG